MKNFICALLSILLIDILYQVFIWELVTSTVLTLEMRIARTVALFLAAAMVTWFLYLYEQLKQNTKAEEAAKVSALQARINPHFFFNCLNSISELVYTNPESADKAIYGLSKLFRVSLQNDNSFHTVDAEIELCRQYLSLESLRLADKLKANIELNIVESKRWLLPKLLIQPIVENAVIHGQNKEGVVDLKIDCRETDRDLSFLVENKISDDESYAKSRKGHGIAIDNIRQRLILLYDDKFVFRTKVANNIHSVLIRFSKKQSKSFGVKSV